MGEKVVKFGDHFANNEEKEDKKHRKHDSHDAKGELTGLLGFEIQSPEKKLAIFRN